MKIIIFDVGNAACSVITSPNNIAMMIDCGSSEEKKNPVDLFYNYKGWLGIAPFTSSKNVDYELGLLHITHPDNDHVRNAKKVKDEIPPYLLRRRKFEEFPDGDSINDQYKQHIDQVYRGTNPESIDWGFQENKIFQIPMRELKSNPLLSKKLRNNSSIMRFISYGGTSILYSGDMETEGWNWLMEHDMEFVNTLSKGLNILIAPHHGHKSGFPSDLFNITGNVDCIIHSKGTEGSIDGTHVSSQYSDKANGIQYKNTGDQTYYLGKVLTTRSNGNIFLEINPGYYNIWAEKASPNHQKVKS